MVAVLAVLSLVVQQRVTTGAFTKLEADQVAQDAQRVRIGLDSWVTLLRNYGATNSIWDASFQDVGAGDRETFAADFVPADLSRLYGLDGVLGVGPDGQWRTGGIVQGDRFVTPPDGLVTSADLRRLFDPSAGSGVGRCGVVQTATIPFLYCGFAAHRSDGGGTGAGGLIYLKAIGGSGLDRLRTQLNLPVALIAAPRPGGIPQAPITSSVGTLLVSTQAMGARQMALDVAVPTVTGGVVRLEAVRPRSIYQQATSVASQLMIIMGALGVLLIAVLVVALRREVRRQVRPLRRVAEQVIESGNRSLRVASTTRGEIGALGRALDRMLDAMARQDESIRQAHEGREAQLHQTYVQQQQASEQVRRAGQQAINDTVEAVARELQEVISGVQAMQTSVASIDDGARATDVVTAQVYDRATAGTRSADAVTGTLQQVSGIARLIESVAGQTKMLALNATIESARAGAAGKGFAVVANEVKQLAATTTTSTSEIARILTTLDRDVATMASVISEMTQGVAGIGERARELTAVAADQRERMRALDKALDTATHRIESMTSLSDSLEGRAGERADHDTSG